MSDSKEKYRGSCDECGSPKGRVHYDDGHWYCYACELYGKEEGEYNMPIQEAPIKGVINNVLTYLTTNIYIRISIRIVVT